LPLDDTNSQNGIEENECEEIEENECEEIQDLIDKLEYTLYILLLPKNTLDYIRRTKLLVRR